MTQKVHNASDDTKSKEKREKSFDEYYKKIISTQEHLERISIVMEKLKKRYEDYEETLVFVEFLGSVEEVFANAEKEKWSVEKTQDEMIKSEIYLLSKMSGVDEDVFVKIYSEFQSASNNVEKIQEIANMLMKKYTEDVSYAKECRDFIMYVRDSLLVFSQALSGNEAFDEIGEVKAQIIRLRMEAMAADNKPPLNVLQKIYKEFVEELQK